jgi:hypothetical protein
MLHAEKEIIDPEFPPEIQGALERFTLNPRGEIDGLALTDETLVRVPARSGEPHAIGAPLTVLTIVLGVLWL